MVFGPHLTLDLISCNQERLKSLELHFKVLNELPAHIGMLKITQPYVFPYEGLIPQDRGITGIVIIAESHVSIHSFEVKNYCFVDVFSCKPFDTEKAIKFIVDTFEPLDYKVNIVERGVGFPR